MVKVLTKAIDLTKMKIRSDYINIAYVNDELSLSEAATKWAEILAETTSVDDLIAFHELFGSFVYLGKLFTNGKSINKNSK